MKICFWLSTCGAALLLFALGLHIRTWTADNYPESILFLGQRLTLGILLAGGFALLAGLACAARLLCDARRPFAGGRHSRPHDP